MHASNENPQGPGGCLSPEETALGGGLAGVCDAEASPKSCCAHCGTVCPDESIRRGDKAFCCQGCRIVFELLAEHGLSDFYRLNDTAGVRVRATRGADAFRFLDDEEVQERFVDFADGKTVRVTFHLPAIHCIACVWLLEQLFRLRPGIGASRVNFSRKELAVTVDPARTRLSDVAALLASLGYEPDLRLSDLDPRPVSRAPRRLWTQLGVAGFAFGNTMLLSISSYLGLDALHGPELRRLFGALSFALALPVVCFSASDYFRLARMGLRRGLLTLEVPIAAGIVALFGQSAFEVVSGRGEGYFDSLCGLVFFLLCGKLFQQKTYDRLAFDRDYKAFFPLAVTRREGAVERRVALGQLRPGDHLLIRHGELIPADGRLVSGPACIDYSFVTGEAAPVAKAAGEHLYAGGRQVGGAIEVEMIKAVSQGYLTSLWDQEPFRKEQGDTFDTITNRYSERFTKLVLAIAAGAALFWAFRDRAVALKAFTSVLIVACPCALALAAPFALGSAQRVLGRRQIFLKNPGLLETLARVDAVVLDKTGTLTSSRAGRVWFDGPALTAPEENWVSALTRHSTHPYAVRIQEWLGSTDRVGPPQCSGRASPEEPVRSFVEIPGCGMQGTVAGREVSLGSTAWLQERGVPVAEPAARPPAEGGGGRGGVVHLAVDGRPRGCFVLASELRPGIEGLLGGLAGRCQLALLSGDHEGEGARFRALFGPSSQLHFRQSPARKLEFIRALQGQGRTVMMVGDGLNDAGALRQGDVGVAVVESAGAFSPASDVILCGERVPQLGALLRYAASAVRVVRLSFFISSLYNVAGVAIAACGWLSPVVCAVLMPLSSVSVVAFASGAAHWLGRRLPPESRTEGAPL